MARLLTIACLAALAALVAAPVASANICTTSSGCEFWDNNYHEVILYDVDTAEVDVLIVPPADATTLWDLPAIEQSIDAWEAGINAKAPAWLGDGLNIHRYTLGTEVPPQNALADPEIIIWSSAVNPVVLFGIGLQVPVSVCRQQSAEQAALTHIHEGVLVEQMSCTDGGAQCHVINTNFLTGSTNRMYDLNAHEFGHCLGIGHVGDAGDFDSKTVPMSDIMSYQYDPGQVFCVSSLNVLALQGVYADLLGQAGQLHPLDYVTQAPSSYSTASCSNPEEGLWLDAAASTAVDPTAPIEGVQGVNLDLAPSEESFAAVVDPLRLF